MYVYMSITIIILFLLSVISLHTCVFSSVKARQLNKPDAGKVYAVVGSTFLEFCFGVPECQVIGYRYWLSILSVCL